MLIALKKNWIMLYLKKLQLNDFDPIKRLVETNVEKNARLMQKLI